MVWVEDLMAGRVGGEVLAVPLVGLSSQCVGVGTLNDLYGAISYVAALACSEVRVHGELCLCSHHCI